MDEMIECIAEALCDKMPIFLTWEEAKASDQEYCEFLRSYARAALSALEAAGYEIREKETGDD